MANSPKHKTGKSRAVTIKASDETIEALTNVFGMLADKSRFKILLALAQDGEMNVTALCHMLGQSQPAVSHHLTLLRMNGLVTFRRQGKHNFYRVNSGLVCSLLDALFADSASTRQILFDECAIIFKRK
jgi:ArsR family transcriptional regulator